MVGHLVNSLGVEHKVTSAYNPRCNGMTERFNFVFTEALKKVCFENNLDWAKWIPYLLIAFRTRIHSTTGFSPFELMFGREMNGFEDWTAIKDGDPVNNLIERTREIKNLVENKYKVALENIKKSQEHQKKSQNKAHRLTEEILPISTKVYVRTEGINDKLYPRFRGPFTVVDYTEFGNYVIENLMRERMSDSYPLQRLKVVPDREDKENGDEFMHVEKIIDARLDYRNKYEYLVKWKV